MSRRRKITVLGIVATAVAAPAAAAPLVKDVAFGMVAQGDGSASSLTKANDLVVRSQKRWHEIWNQLNAGVQTMPPTGAQYQPPPAVDFKRRMLLVVLQGQRRSGGYSIAVTRVTKVAGQLVAKVEEQSPGPSCFTTQQITSPYHVVSVPRSARAVVFRHRAGTTQC